MDNLQQRQRQTSSQGANKRKSRVRRLSSLKSLQLKMENEQKSKSVRRKRFSRHLTTEGDEYFVPVSGEGVAVWTLPENAEVVHF